MQWPPTRPGWKSRKFHLVRAASRTSWTEMPRRWQIIATSLTKAMLMSRCAFSIALAASAVRMSRREMDLAAGDPAVDRGEAFGDLGGLAGDHLGDALERVLTVAGIDPLGRVAEEEVAAGLQARGLGQGRADHLLGDAGIDGALEHHDRARPERLADRCGRRRSRRTRSGRFCAVDRGRHGDDEDLVAGEALAGRRSAPAGLRASSSGPTSPVRSRPSWSSAIRPRSRS